MLLGSSPNCSRIFAIRKLSAAAFRMRSSAFEMSAWVAGIGTPGAGSKGRKRFGQKRQPNKAQMASRQQREAIAFSSEVETGSREENASKQESGASVLTLSEPKLQSEIRRGSPRGGPMRDRWISGACRRCN